MHNPRLKKTNEHAMKQFQILTGMLAICVALATGCGEEDEISGGGGIGGNAPIVLNGAEYNLTEPSGTSTIEFTLSGDNYTLTRPGMPTQAGTYVSNKVGNDTWDVMLNNALDGSASRLVLTFTGVGIGNFSFAPPTGPTINGQFRRTGLTNLPGGNNNGGNTSTNGTGGTITAPGTLSQIVINGQAGNPSGSGQTLININGATFSYAGSNIGGTVTYSPTTGDSAQLLLNYNNSTDFDDYTLQFNAPSGSAVLSSYSGTQRVGNVTGPASGSFTYTQ